MACDFVDIDDPFESKVLPQISKTVSAGISIEQEAAATEAVAGFVKAFSNGRYADFKAFLFLSKPAQKPLTMIHPKAPDWAVLDTPWGPLPTLPPTKEHEVKPENLIATIHRRASYGTKYKQYFDGICVEKSHLTLLYTNQLAALLREDGMKNTINLGVSDPSGGRRIVQFEQTPSDVMKENGGIAYLTTKLHLRLAHPEPVKLIYCRWYWEPSEGKWLPLNLVVGSLQRRSKIGIVFL